jgi:hypothetical protein
MKKQNAIRVFQLLSSVAITLFLAGVLVPSLMGSSRSANHTFFPGPLHTIQIAGFAFKYKFQNILAALLGTVFGGVMALVIASPAAAKKNTGSPAAAFGAAGDAGSARQAGADVAKSFNWFGGLLALLKLEA